MKFTTVLLKIILVIIPTVFLFSQDSTEYLAVRNLFKTDESVWFNYYSGYDNLGNQYFLILGNNQTTEMGFLNVLNKKIKLQVEGPFKKLKFIVTDSTGEIWGNMFGSKKDSLFTLNLISVNKKQAFDLSLKQIKKNYPLPMDCPENLINSVYTDDSLNTYLNIQLFEDGKVHAYFISIKDSLTLFLNGHCEDPQCEKIQFLATSLTNWQKEKFQLTRTDEIKLQFKKFPYSNKEKLNKVSKYEFTCKNFLKNQQVVQARYLNINNRAYQRWIQEFAINWINSTLSKVNTALDSSVNAKLNFDVCFATNQLISGNFFWNEPGYRLNINYPFNFNLRSGEIIQLSDIFDKNADYKSFLRNYIDSSKQILSKKLQPAVRNFILNDQFNYWTILPTGLCFTSEFHSIYGTYRLLVPFRKLEPMLKRNSILKKYF
ncbi:MAG: hypothetical protein ABI851_15215 [Saprospiraceae bacterium]